MSKTLDDIALKYNWWTKQEDKKNISEYVKISYVFLYGNIFEITSIFKNHSFELLQKAFRYIENDNFALKPKRKKVISYLLTLKQNGYI